MNNKMRFRFWFMTEKRVKKIIAEEMQETYLKAMSSAVSDAIVANNEKITNSLIKLGILKESDFKE